MHLAVRVPLACVPLALAASLLAGCGKKDGSSAGKVAGTTVEVTLTDDGCSPESLTAESGGITFNVTNSGSSKVTEFELKNDKGLILGEKENVIPGIDGSFTLTLDPGTYAMVCPNGNSKKNGTLVVTGEPVGINKALPTALLETATNDYRAYIVSQTETLLADTKAFVAALESGDLQAAKDLFGKTRLPYEAIEPVAESFGNLDPELDAREGDVPATEWSGFHRIEKILWKQGTTDGTAALGKKLIADVTTLDAKVRTLAFQPAQLANGAVELLDEVASSKITGEEDRYSHTDLSDFQGNLSGSRKAFDLLRPALEDLGEGDLAETIDERFQKVQDDLDEYKRSTPLGFAVYDELTDEDRRAFAQDVQALAEPLSTVAAKVSG